MNLIKAHWNTSDIEDFQAYLKTFENPLKRDWSKNILQTELPILCLTTAIIKDIVNKISKGNYLEFLDLMIWEFYENTAINGFLITKIKDFKTMKKYLDIYSKKADNWATCDLLSFNIKNSKDNFWNLSLEYIKSKLPFVRRIGIYILFNYVNDEHIEQIFNILDQFEKEKHYYVNMMSAWLLCECFIKEREKTLKYLADHKLNKFIINKAVQKCRESRRVSVEDKETLLKYKIK